MNKRKSAQWSRLDNAAKIFPPTSSKSDPKVFRFSCELYESVEPQLLQQAAEKALESFPHFRTVLRRGLFWYYLEGSPLPMQVREESDHPCSPLYDSVEKKLLFSIFYYRRRISFEVYHALTDGTGALQFLRMLVYHYLLLRHADALRENPPILDYDASLWQKNDDSFRRYYNNGAPKKRVRGPLAYRVAGARLSENRIRVIEGELSAASLLGIARSYHTTITALIAALLICAIHAETPVREQGKPIIVSVPVNLRKYFQSESARNFFGVIKVEYTFSAQDVPLQEVIAAVSERLAHELTPDRLSQRMNALSALEHNFAARIIPLFVKDISLMIAGHVSRREETFSLSNVGQVQMPEQLVPYIRLFDIFNSADQPKLCMCSFNDRMLLSVTSPFVSTDIQRRFFRSLAQLGIPLIIRSNQPDEE